MIGIVRSVISDRINVVNKSLQKETIELHTTNNHFEIITKG